MKKFILITVFFVLISKLLLAQNDSSFKKADEFIYGSDSSFNQFVLTKKLMTNGGLNLFFAKRINTYLTGSSDLSVNQSYFVVDPTDGRLTIGHSWNTNPSLKGERAKHMLTLGLKTNVKDNLSSIYSGSKKWSGNMGITLKYTITGRGVISYNDTKMKQELRNITDNESNIHQGFAIRNISKLNKNLKEAIAKDNTEINEEIQYGKDSLKWELSYLEKRKDKVIKESIEKNVSDFISKEEAFISKNNLFDYFWTHWVSFDIYIPITKNKYDYTNSFNGILETKSLFNFEGTVSYSNLLETPKSRWITNIALGGKKNNTISTSLIDKYSFGDYKKLGGVDTLKLAQLETKDIYVGKYEEYFTPFLRLSAVSFFMFKKSVGLSFLYEKNFGSYNPTNIKLGIPFNLRGKDDDTKATFELQFKWDDYNNNILPNKTRSEKYTLGLSVGIPLATKI